MDIGQTKGYPLAALFGASTCPEEGSQRISFGYPISRWAPKKINDLLVLQSVDDEQCDHE
jgi:hypothetical protein